MNDLYIILGIEPTASKSEIKKAFKLLSLKYHPDKNNEINTNDKFIEIRNAYEILIDDGKKQIYDYHRKFTFLKDYEINETEMNIITEIYEKVINSNEIKFMNILFKTLPDNIKRNIHKFKDNIFKESNDIIISNKYINIEKLNEDFILNLNIKILDVYNNSLKIIIVHTQSGIYYLYLRFFDKDIIVLNGNKKFKLTFNITDKCDFIKKGKDLIIIEKINIYELLFVKNYNILLPNDEIVSVEKQNNIHFLKNYGFQTEYNSKKGNLLILFHLDYKKNYSNYENSIKEIFN